VNGRVLWLPSHRTASRIRERRLPRYKLLLQGPAHGRSRRPGLAPARSTQGSPARTNRKQGPTRGGHPDPARSRPRQELRDLGRPTSGGRAAGSGQSCSGLSCQQGTTCGKLGGSGMPACGGDFGLRILDRAGSSAEGNPEPLEARLEIEAGKLEQLGCLAEIYSLVEVVAERPSFEKLASTTCVASGGTKGEGSQKTVVESIQENDALLPSAGNNGELSLMHPVQDLSGPLGQIGWGDSGSRHRRCLSVRVPHPKAASKFGAEESPLYRCSQVPKATAYHPPPSRGACGPAQGSPPRREALDMEGRAQGAA